MRGSSDRIPESWQTWVGAILGSRRLQTGLTVTLTLVIFGLLLSFVDVERTLDSLSASDPWLILASMLLMVLVLAINARRWEFVLSAFDRDVPFRRCFALELATLPILVVTPSKTGEALKAYLLRDSVPLSESALSIVYQRIFDLVFLVGLGNVGAALFTRSWARGNILPAVVLGLSSLAIILVARHYLEPLRWLSERLPGRKTLSRLGDWSVVWRTAAYSGLIFGLTIVQVVLFFEALGIMVPATRALFFVPLAILVGVLPITVAGMGTRDTAFIVLFSGLAPPEELLAVGLLFSFVRYWSIAVLGLPVLFWQTGPD